MKPFQLAFLFSICLLVFTSCNEAPREADEVKSIENKIKTVSLFLDTIPSDADELMESAERINAAIDSIGYPDAGYKIWMVKSQDSLDFKFMVEGYWPSDEVYDIIHQHKLYKQTMQQEEAVWQGLQRNWYYRFERVN